MQSIESVIAALDAESKRLFSEGLDAEQVECINDASRTDEALGMLDDMQARMGFDPLVIAQAIEAINARN